MTSIIQRSITFAEELQNRIQANMSAEQRQFQCKMQKLLENPAHKVMLIELLDRSFRSSDQHKSFELITHILEKYGIADFFSAFERFLLFCFVNVGGIAPNISVPFFVSHIRNDTKAMVLDSEPASLEVHTLKRAQEGVRLNVNLIGEEVLGEAEANHRIHKYEQALKSSYITYISIKITTIFSQIHIIDFEYSKNEVVKRLDSLYALALQEQERQGVPKFINLDMEEFRDLELTVSAFMESISKFDIEAGIVLQAYLPDSYEYLKRLCEFSKQRVLEGKKPIKIRFVKGANMESEETIASQRGWNLPTFSRKVDTDSNYKKMLDYVLSDECYKFIRIGIASHNIFEIAYSYIQASEAGALESFTFEMLEGMSMQASKEISALHPLVLYAPVCDEKHFNNAIAYLVRRLDENTGEDNFMRYSFGLSVGNAQWEQQKALFIQSVENIGTIDNTSLRVQNRLETPSAPENNGGFVNEPDTDFVLSCNQKWAKKIRDSYQNMLFLEVCATASEPLHSSQKLEVCEKIGNKPIGCVHLADEIGLKEALQRATQSDFGALGFEKIASMLIKSAQIMRERRGELLGIAALEVGKTFMEIDAEVSEAIDFLEFYPHSLKTLQDSYPQTHFTPKGVGVVIAPWNFPIGISVGTIAAPLAAGNKVIYKPSSLSMLTGYRICECLWDAGIPRDALIFCPSRGSDVSEFLLKSKDVAFSVLTGGEDTAYKMLEANPALLLSAETGGKNATIVSKMADRDQAVKNIIQSAFSNAGQKCSATSLLILEKEVYEDENFKQSLVDAARSMAVGDPLILKNKIGLLADKPGEKLKKAIREIESHEEWVLKPEFMDGNEHMMTPGIKYGTRKGDFTHMTELFAPLLSVMCASNLKEAIGIANSTGYGLTSGLESLDEREWCEYRENIEAGNIYINKPTTGAIVLRQPFGGIKKSAIGFGRKVGVYNYITQFLNITQANVQNFQVSHPLVSKLQNVLKIEGLDDRLVAVAQSYAFYFENEFSQEFEYVKVRGEDNLFLYKPIASCGYRISQGDSVESIVSVALACMICGIRLEISYDSQNEAINKAKNILQGIGFNGEIRQEDSQAFCLVLERYERVRYMGDEEAIYRAAAKLAKIIVRDQPLCNGRFELLYYMNERSVSISYHRYGNLGARVLESK